MADINGFNAHNVEPNREFDPVPAGKYVAVITDSEMKETKAGTGSYLEFTFEIVDGEFKGRKLWSRLNLDNPNPVAVKIARGELSAICRAVGVMEPRDSAQLHNLPLTISVKLKADSDGELRNVIKGYAKRESATSSPTNATASPTSASPSALPSQAANSTPPWRR